MKGIFKWFKSGAKMKRWMLLILVGVVLASYGMADLLVHKELEFVELAKIIASFVVGFSCIINGIIFMQRRTLELFVQDTDKYVETKKGAEVKSLIFNKKVYDEGPNVVVIGGGSGLNSVLRGLKTYTSNITAIVTVSDFGDHTNDISREKLHLLPSEEIKESFIALAKDEEKMKEILRYKFNDGNLDNINCGDILLKAMQENSSNFAKSVEDARKVLNITGRVIPVTLEEIKICAELDDGTVIESKNKIPEVVSDKVSKISRIFISPSNCNPAPGVIDAIENADAIVIGPGSLYTNVIPNLLVKGVSKAIKDNTRAFKIYVGNIMTEPGQTDDYALSDHVKAIVDHAGKGIIDYCIYDMGDIIPEYVRKYNLKGSELVEQDIQKVKNEGINLIQRDLVTIDNGYIRHNSDAIATTIIELLCDDMKFRDMHNDSKYLILNTKLKKKNRELKKIDKYFIDDKKNKKKKNSKKSKFYSKYSDRIDAIKESDEKIKLKNQMAMKDQVMREIQNTKKKQAVSVQQHRNVEKTVKKENIYDEFVDLDQIKPVKESRRNVSNEANEIVSKIKKDNQEELLRQLEKEQTKARKEAEEAKKEKARKKVATTRTTAKVTKTTRRQMTPDEIEEEERRKFLETINKMRR